ncbi:MAG: NAD(P)H-dependent glycerol-3-phosphate dehydrogenase [Candidatus Eiseniibacteriota bacterium]|nr:MAG: NAD(P)H-dependent glycerol-3-phosphate dehydrogenase [Candidatus Eisenbacteria bacterium]
MSKVAILGGGGWGTALSIVLSSKGVNVKVWEYDQKQCELVKASGKNEKFLAGVPVPQEVVFTSEISQAVRGSEVLVFAVPSHTLRGVARKLAKQELSLPLVVSATKGIEDDSLMRMSEVLADELPLPVRERIVVLAGPSHAEEVSRGQPTTVVSACRDRALAKHVQDLFSTGSFRVYTNEDVIGVELGVSTKNVIAIAAGICDGVGYGDNTKAALMTRGLAEMMRLGLALGAERETFFGLAGVGDLVATCLSKHSRNRYVGEEVGKGKSLESVLSGMVMVAEGVRTTRSTLHLAKRRDVEMPITEQIYNVLFEGKDAHSAIDELMSRELKPEMW